MSECDHTGSCDSIDYCFNMHGETIKKLEAELKDAKELSELRLKSEQKHAWENLRLRKALEKIHAVRCEGNEPMHHICENLMVTIAKQALSEEQ